MKTVYLYGIGGTVAVLGFLVLVKKKKPATAMMRGPGSTPKLPGGSMRYNAAPGDNPLAVAARFGVPENQFMRMIQANGGKPILMRNSQNFPLPPGVADLGPRQGAQGTVS